MSAIPKELEARLSAEGYAWLEDWLGDPFDESILPRLHFLLEHRRFDELADAFSKRLAVGTGGMRGPIGVGPNRYNHETLGRAVQGHAEFLRTRFPERFADGVAPPSLVIAYDVRRFHDTRDLYDGFSDRDPLTEVSSRDFALFAAVGYALNGLRPVLPPPGAPFISTPELSLAIRSGGHLAGVNISASHNPPDDNGIKFYNSTGAQLAGVDADLLQETIWRVDLPDPPDEDAAEDALAAITDYDAAVHAAFIELAVRGLPVRDGSTIVYAPLEGVGADCTAEALRRIAPGVHVLGGIGDGRFTSVPYGLPNPEITAVFAPVQAYGDAHGCDLLLATDPDADRVAVVARTPEGGWHAFDGNQIGALLLEWLCRRLEAAGTTDLSGHALIQTCVTGEETVRIAASRGLAVTSDLPVGFKFIARAIDAVLAQGKQVLLAFEESIGYLRLMELREKDATSTATMLAAAHLELAAAGSSLVQLYRELNARHGYHRSSTRSLVMKGPEGVRVQERMIAALRHAGGVPGSTLKLTRDYEATPSRLLDLSAAGDRQSLNVLELRGRLASADVRMCIRRSGTEPKIKLYFEVSGNPEDVRDDVAFESIRAVLSLVELSYSRACHALPDHIPLSAKQELESRIAPELFADFAASGGFTRTPALDRFLQWFAGGTLDPLFDALWRLGGESCDVAELDDFIRQLAKG